jgi:hypothetical protein
MRFLLVFCGIALMTSCGGLGGTGGSGGLGGTGGAGGAGGTGGKDQPWADSSSGLVWQNPAPSDKLNWADAGAYCDGLTLAGNTDWRLPTIGELRSLIRGCPATVTVGACGVTDACLDYSTCLGSTCDGCSSMAGPGTDGGYWDPAVSGQYWFGYWSASSLADDASSAWYVVFREGSVRNVSKVNPQMHVRCVRVGS